jgi:hypothetical protein
VAEYQELEQVARRLGLIPDDSETVSPVRTRRSASRRGRSGTSQSAAQAPSGKRATGSRRRRTAASEEAITRAPRPRRTRGQRGQQLLALVQERPGITVREAGEQLGVEPTSLYRVVRRLEENGAVKKQGRGLQPA